MVSSERRSQDPGPGAGWTRPPPASRLPGQVGLPAARCQVCGSLQGVPAPGHVARGSPSTCRVELLRLQCPQTEGAAGGEGGEARPAAGAQAGSPAGPCPLTPQSAWGDFTAPLPGPPTAQRGDRAVLLHPHFMHGACLRSAGPCQGYQAGGSQDARGLPKCPCFPGGQTEARSGKGHCLLP